MKDAQHRHPLVMSAFDLPDAHNLLLSSCEDCACAVTETQAGTRRVAPVVRVGGAETRWVCASGVAEIPLDAEHRVLFNPFGSSGAVVVNSAAYEVFLACQTSASARDIQADSDAGELDALWAFRRLGELQMITPIGQRSVPRFEDSKVLTAWLHITNACNLRCPYCYISKSSDQMDEEIGRATVEAIIGSALANGFAAVKLKYAGGEASLNHRLVMYLHAYARRLVSEAGLGLYATLLSNGVRMPESLIEDCKANGIRVMISLDGVGDQHDIQRRSVNGRPSFRAVDRTISDLIARNHKPHLSITITNRNVHGVPDVVRYALERDLTFSLNLFRDNECAASFDDLRYEERSIIDTFLEAFRVIEAFLPRWSVLGSILDRGQLLQPRQRSCGVGQDYVVIDQNGQVAKCHMEIEKTLGNVFASDPLALVRADTSTALNLLVDEKEGCRECHWRYWCSGGCSVATFRSTGRYDVKSPNCNIYKAIYPAALRLEGLRVLKYARAEP